MAKRTAKRQAPKKAVKKSSTKIDKKPSTEKVKKSNNFIKTLDSKLVTDINQIELIKTGIKNFDNTKELQLKLLFRASRDGDNNKAYHDLCDGNAPTINVIKSKNGYIFGGYTDCLLNSTSDVLKLIIHLFLVLIK
jgi:hypothetical protein